MEPSSENARQRLAALIATQASCDGFSESALPGVRYARAVRPYPMAPVLYDPSIVILATGRKRAVFGETVHTLDPGHYWVVSVPLAFSCQTLATAEDPLYGLSLRVDPAVLGELLLEMEDWPDTAVKASASMSASRMTPEMADTAVRLAGALAAANTARILGPGIVREMIFRVLEGSQGAALKALAARNGRLRPISRVLMRIHTDFREEFDVETLAREAHMGLSTFHHAFRAVTATTPLQYLKTVRLHKARSYLTEPGATIREAAQRVGYASASQFSREFKRLFGASPSEEIGRLGPSPTNSAS